MKTRLILLWLLLLSSCATDKPVSQSLPAFQEVQISKLMSFELSTDVRLKIQIPAEYRRHEVPCEHFDAAWAADEDWKRLAKGDEATKRHGFIIAKISMNFGYDEHTDRFFGGD